MGRHRKPGSISHKRKEYQLTAWQRHQREKDHLAFLKVAPQKWAERSIAGRPPDREVRE